MAAADAVPHDTIPPGTTLYRCRALVGDIVVILAMGRYRPARVIGTGPVSARLIYPSPRAGRSPHRPARRHEELYALVGTEVAGVIQAGARPRYGHRLAAPLAA